MSSVPPPTYWWALCFQYCFYEQVCATFLSLNHLYGCMFSLLSVMYLGIKCEPVELPECPCPAPSYILANSKASLQCLHQHFPCLSPLLRLHQMSAVFLWFAFSWLMKSSTFPCVLWDLSSQISSVFELSFQFSEFFSIHYLDTMDFIYTYNFIYF